MKNFYSDRQALNRYIQRRDSGASRNEIIEEKAFLHLLDDVGGLHCLDIGCGYGYYSRLLAERGAKVLGVDKAQLMIQEAKDRSAEYTVNYKIGDIEDISFSDEAFDLIISNLTLHYIRDLEALLLKTYRWLKKEGSFIFTIEHPIFTANIIQEEPQWCDPSTHTKWIVSDYFRSGERNGTFGLKYHRTLEEYFNAVIEAGYQVRKILEPAPDDAGLKIRPDLLEDLHRPLYLALKCKKGQ